MLEDEVAWLGNFVPSLHPDMSDTDNSLLAGHLKLITTLLTCEGVDEEEHGRWKKIKWQFKWIWEFNVKGCKQKSTSMYMYINISMYSSPCHRCECRFCIKISIFDVFQDEPWCMISCMTSSFLPPKWWWTVWTPVVRRSFRKLVQSKTTRNINHCLSIFTKFIVIRRWYDDEENIYKCPILTGYFKGKILRFGHFIYREGQIQLQPYFNIPG